MPQWYAEMISRLADIKVRRRDTVMHWHSIAPSGSLFVNFDIMQD
jgi:hypothetical protein